MLTVHKGNVNLSVIGLKTLNLLLVSGIVCLFSYFISAFKTQNCGISCVTILFALVCLFYSPKSFVLICKVIPVLFCTFFDLGRKESSNCKAMRSVAD